MASVTVFLRLGMSSVTPLSWCPAFGACLRGLFWASCVIMKVLCEPSHCLRWQGGRPEQVEAEGWKSVRLQPGCFPGETDGSAFLRSWQTEAHAHTFPIQADGLSLQMATESVIWWLSFTARAISCQRPSEGTSDLRFISPRTLPSSSFLDWNDRRRAYTVTNKPKCNFKTILKTIP